MPFNRNHVRGFLAKPEIALFESSLGSELKALTTADLQSKIGRTRELRDKYRDLLQRQKLATRARTGTKMGASGEANERTAKKAKAFSEILARFEARLKYLTASAKKAAAKAKGQAKGQAKSKSSAAASKPTPAKKSAAKKAVKSAAKAAGASAGSAKRPVSAKPAKTKQAKAVASKAVTKKAAAKKGVAKKVAAKQAPAKTAPASKKLVPAAVMLRKLLTKKRTAQALKAKAPSTRSRKAPAASRGPVGDVGATPPDVRAAAVSSRLEHSGLPRIQGHTATQVRKAQAKRDSRG